MSAAPIRYVLARAAEQGFFEAVAPAVAAFDPLRRGSIRRKARQAFMEASASTKVTDEAHVLRYAFLRIGPRPAPPADDIEAVRQAFEAEKVYFPKRKGSFPVLTVSLVALVVLAAAAVIVVLTFPSPRDRFARSALGEAMGDGLTDWTVGVSRRDLARQDKGRTVILTRGVKHQIGEGAFNLLGTALDQSKLVRDASTPEEAERQQEALASTLRTLDADLQTKKLPAFFDDYVDTGLSMYSVSTNVWLLGYYVEDRATLTVGTNTVPMLRGRRLDNLNLEVGGKAYESKVLGGWIISLDEIEEWTILNVVPALGKGHGFAFGGKAPKEEGSEGRLATKVGERIRGDLLVRSGLTEDEGTELADLLSQRHSAFLRLAVLGDELYEPRGLTAKPRLKQALSKRKDVEMDAREITRIEDKLSRFVKPFALVAYAQAAIDETRVAADATCKKATACTFTADPDLAKSMGGDSLLGAKAAAVASHLTMVARSDTTFLALAEAEMGPGGYAAWFMIERELGLAPDWLSPYGVKDEMEHGQLGVALFDKPADQIRKAAETAYAKVFGAPMPAVARTVAGR